MENSCLQSDGRRVGASEKHAREKPVGLPGYHNGIITWQPSR